MSALRSACLLTAIVFLGTAPALYPHQAGGKDSRQLVLLVAVPDDRPTVAEASWNDHVAMYQALRGRGFQAGQILTLSGAVGRQQLLDFLRDAGRRVAKWPDGLVVL